MTESTSRSSLPEPGSGTRVRDRIFKTARELFYRQGIRAVGVDAIACEAGTNKMSFYRSFASKDELVAECLRVQTREYWEWWDGVVAPHAGDARRQIQALFEASVAKVCSKDTCGCPISNAAVELREEGHPGHKLIRAFKNEIRSRMRALAREAGAADADTLGDALMLLLEGVTSSKLTFAGRTGPLTSSVAAAEALLEAFLPAATAKAPARATRTAARKR